MRKIIIVAAMGFAAGCLLPLTSSFAAELSRTTSKNALDIFGRRGADDPAGDVRGEGTGHPLKSTVEITTTG